MYRRDLCMFCLFCCFYDGVNAVQLRADFQPKKGKKNHFFPNRTTEFIHETTVYKAGREHWYGKEVCTNHRYVASTPQTSGPRWLPSCSHPQSRVLIFSALFLTIWSMRVIGTQCITDLSLCESVRIHVLVYMYCLFAK